MKISEILGIGKKLEDAEKEISKLQEELAEVRMAFQKSEQENMELKRELSAWKTAFQEMEREQDRAITQEKFAHHVAERIMDFLPSSYEGAVVEVQEKAGKDGDDKFVLFIRRDGHDSGCPMRLDYVYKQYKQGMDIDDLLQDIADAHVDFERNTEVPDIIKRMKQEQKSAPRKNARKKSTQCRTKRPVMYSNKRGMEL